MSNIIVFAVRRTVLIALVLTLVMLLAAACAGEEEDAGGLTDGLTDSTPTTSVPTTAAPTTAAPTTPAPATTPATGTGASPTAGASDGTTAITLEDVQTHVEDSMPDVNVDDITAVDYVDGELMVETAWDSTMEADAQSLCEDLLAMTTETPFESVTINGSDGSSLAECGA